MRNSLLTFLVWILLAPNALAIDQRDIDLAVARGVEALKKRAIGTGTTGYDMGATALVGLTLLECDVPRNDPVVQQAAQAVRSGAISNTHTYSLALGVLFLDKLDDNKDTPLIESMLVRLLGGQSAIGNWTYNCPGTLPEEAQRLQNEAGGVLRVLRGGRDLNQLAPKGSRTIKDLPEPLQNQLQRLGPAQAGNVPVGAAAGVVGIQGDNSNTQFATLALWVGRRYGVPTQAALLRADDYFRKHQNADGGWGYMPGMVGASTATMTCAGVMALAFGHGARLDVKKSRDPKIDKQDVSKDNQIKTGLAVLGTVVGTPQAPARRGVPQLPIPQLSGRAYYFLWSLQRVAVTLELERLDRKDWYTWGAEIILANQQADGHWVADHAHYSADTCFALLFLKKANIARDLSGKIVGLRQTPIVLRAGGVGGADLKSKPVLGPTGIGDGPGRKSSPSERSDNQPRQSTSVTRSDARPGGSEAAGKSSLADQLVRARGKERTNLLEKLRDSKGVENTEALLSAIEQLEGEERNDARHALAQRLTRMKDSTLKGYLADPEPEMRRAAALALAARQARPLCGDLIRLLDDPEPVVRRAAHAALKDLTGKDFGPAEGASAAERKKAVAAWQRWWLEQAGD